MSNLKFYSILLLSALLVLSACRKDDGTSSKDDGTSSEEALTPVLTLSRTTLTVPVEGG